MKLNILFAVILVALVAVTKNDTVANDAVMAVLGSGHESEYNYTRAVFVGTDTWYQYVGELPLIPPFLSDTINGAVHDLCSGIATGYNRCDQDH